MQLLSAPGTSLTLAPPPIGNIGLGALEGGTEESRGASWAGRRHLLQLHIQSDGEHRSDLIVNAGRGVMSKVGRGAAASLGSGPFPGRSSRCRRGGLR